MIRLLKFYILHPEFWTLFFKKAFSAFRTRLRIKTAGLYSPKWYPKEIRTTVESLDMPIPKSVFEPNCFQELNRTASWDENLNLAGKEISLSEIQDQWCTNTEDNEVIFASHRFHWLIEAVSQGIDTSQYKKIEEKIKRWHQLKHSLHAWEPYSISERICHFSTFFWTTKQSGFLSNEFKELLISTIHTHTLRLVGSLEYPASEVTNNHILNNARALYFAGTLLQNENLKNLSKRIFSRECDAIIDKFGFLKECSTHYQFLVNKNIIELALLEMSQGEKSYFQQLAEKMTAASLLLLPKKNDIKSCIPLIGDVSPDISTTWYLPEQCCDWSRVWKNTINSNESSIHAGWFVIEDDDWFLLTQTHQQEGPYPLGHGHDDLGSFVLYFKGVPIIIDRGRNSYNPVLGEGIYRFDHNTLLEKPSPALISGQGIREGMSLQSKRKLKAQLNKNLICLGIENCWEREFHINNEFSVQDKVNGEVSGFLYISPQLIVNKIEDNIYFLTHEEFTLKLEFSREVIPQQDRTTIFPSYGKVLSSQRITWSANKNYSFRISRNA